jgi:protein-S-isoprenylcysteine O-methyltransferase Ste14
VNTENLTSRPQLLDWLAGVALLALIVSDRFLERGTNPILRVLGLLSLILAPVFFLPPFVLLKRHGHVEDGRPFYDTEVAVDRGLYAVVRHPQYLGYIFLTMGFVLLSQNVVTFSFGAVAIVLFYVYTLREEEFCVRHLGSAYEDYCKRVPRFNVMIGMIRYLMRKRSVQ